MKSGIYAIEHIKSGRLYIGSSVDIRSRWRTHVAELKRGGHRNGRLQAAWLRDGCWAFSFTVLERVGRDELIDREQYYVDIFFPHVYNIARVVSAPMLGRKWSEEQHATIRIKKMGHPVSAETRAKIGDANRGRRLSIERRESIRAVNTGKRHSAETRARMSATRTGKTLDRRIFAAKRFPPNAEAVRFRHFSTSRAHYPAPGCPQG